MFIWFAKCMAYATEDDGMVLSILGMRYVLHTLLLEPHSAHPNATRLNREWWFASSGCECVLVVVRREETQE